MRVTFIMPASARFPAGGYKVVFEYANHLSTRGHAVTIVFPALLDPTKPAVEKLYHMSRYALWGATNRFGPQRWFPIRPAVKLLWVPTLREANIPFADAVVAAGWPSAEFVATYSRDKGRKFYLIQHYETWWGSEARVRATWQLPLRKIVIARWLGDIAESMGENAAYIPNGLDFTAFGCDVPVALRNHPSVSMLYHKFDWKGSADGLEALTRARNAIPDLSVTLFGVYRQPPHLPKWVSYRRNPAQSDLRRIYNHSAVFLAPSWAEGWPLPPAEAMMCGATVVCTDIGGHREYAEHERNALLAPPRDPHALASALVRVLSDAPLRQALAARGNSDIKRFTWSAAVDQFEAELNQTTLES
jgi:glycosyltransferase involved in cell wall biosynthesis